MWIKQNKHDFEKEFQKIRREYIRDLKDQIHRLETLLKKERWENIYRIGHRLRGSGESYGFKEISSVGGKIQEAALKCDQVKLRQWLSELQGIEKELENALNLED